ncbi:DUF4097 family beta strand repeat-containing protein [Georgenia halophila]|uniref:DUF4097 family beta strand repeat-containing protein n=1 Tax=Georgenia halophila TaxID=620889 RepID=A0ABP8LBR1_9MICO
MRHEFPVVGPVRVHAGVRSSDLLVTASHVDLVTVDVEGGDDGSVDTVRVALTGEVLRIEVPPSRPRLFSGGSSLRITVSVPEWSLLDVASRSGDVTASGPLSSVAVKSGSGDVDLGHADETDIDTGSGDVTVTSLGTGRVQTGSGDVSVRSASGLLRSRSGSGDVSLGDLTELEATTASGDLLVRELRGSANVRTASGNVDVRRAVHGHLDAKTASGDVSVRVVEGTAVMLDCSSVSGRVTSSLEPGGEPGPDEPTLVLRARTVSGNVRVQRTT